MKTNINIEKKKVKRFFLAMIGTVAIIVLIKVIITIITN